MQKTWVQFGIGNISKALKIKKFFLKNNGTFPWASLPWVAQMVKSLPAMQKTWVQSLGPEDLPEKGMATPFSILDWEITWTEETNGLQSMGLHGVGLI